MARYNSLLCSAGNGCASRPWATTWLHSGRELLTLSASSRTPRNYGDRLNQDRRWVDSRRIVASGPSMESGVARKSHLAVGLRVSAMGWASVSRGIVMMGDSSITLCSSSRAARCCSMITLCVSETGGGSRISSMRAPRSLRSRRPLSVVPAMAVCSVSSSVNARKC